MSQCIVEFTEMAMGENAFSQKFRPYLERIGHVVTVMENEEITKCTVIVYRPHDFSLGAFMAIAADMHCDMHITYLRNDT